MRGYLPAEGEQIGNLMDSTTEEDNIAELIQRKQELLYVTAGELGLGTMHGGMHGCTRRRNQTFDVCKPTKRMLTTGMS